MVNGARANGESANKGRVIGGFLPVFIMVFSKKGEFLPVFIKGRWGFLRCLPRFWHFETQGFGGAGGRNHGDTEGTERWGIATDEHG
jgi:hypothetical protein